MTDDILYSGSSSAMIVALTALLRAEGVDAGTAFERAAATWREHLRVTQTDSWELSALREVVTGVTGR